MMWEVLMEEDIMEKIKEYARQYDLKITIVKVDMKKLSIKERITNIAELKQLQQEVENLYEKEQKRNDDVT